MKKPIENLMRFGAYIGGMFAMLLMGCTAAFLAMMMLMESASATTAMGTVWSLLPAGLRMTGFTLSTALVSVLLSFPLAWSLATAVSFMLQPRPMRIMRNGVSGLSAIPAVVFGYMSLNYFVPGISSAWWGVTVTLLLMSLMRQTLEILNVNRKHFAAVEAAQAMGALTHETVLYYVLPRAGKGYLSVALRTLVRCMGEGVAILLVLSAYGPNADTLPTAIMKAVGVTGEMGEGRWLLLLTLLLLALVLLTNAMISYCLEGGQYGKKKDV